MNIVLGEERVLEVRDKYTVLELDTFRGDNGESVTAYCVLELDNIEDLFTLEQFKNLHKNLMRNYRCQNWTYCEQALAHLMGKWRGKVDSFYENLDKRIKQHRIDPPHSDWDGVIERSTFAHSTTLSQ